MKENWLKKENAKEDNIKRLKEDGNRYQLSRKWFGKQKELGSKYRIWEKSCLSGDFVEIIVDIVEIRRPLPAE